MKKLIKESELINMISSIVEEAIQIRKQKPVIEKKTKKITQEGLEKLIQNVINRTILNEEMSDEQKTIFQKLNNMKNNILEFNIIKNNNKSPITGKLIDIDKSNLPDFISVIIEDNDSQRKYNIFYDDIDNDFYDVKSLTSSKTTFEPVNNTAKTIFGLLKGNNNEGMNENEILDENISTDPQVIETIIGLTILASGSGLFFKNFISNKKTNNKNIDKLGELVAQNKITQKQAQFMLSNYTVSELKEKLEELLNSKDNTTNQ